MIGNRLIAAVSDQLFPELIGASVIHALCFGMFFGFPFIVWGWILIFDRDRTWQKRLRRSQSRQMPKRTRAWDIRQLTYGALMIVLGITIISLLTFFNYLAQGVSPPAPL